MNKLENWNIWEMLKGNKDFIKYFVSLIVGLFVYFGVDNNLVSIISVFMTKFLTDIVDYAYLKSDDSKKKFLDGDEK